MIFTKKLTHFLSLIFLAIHFAVFIAPEDANSKSRGLGRIRQCSLQGDPEGLDFDPGTAGKDVEFVMSNPLCASFAAHSYIGVKIGISKMNIACGNSGTAMRYTPTPILDSIDITKSVAKSLMGNKRCLAGVGEASAKFAGMLSILASIWGISKHVYNSTEVCGANWQSPNPQQFLINRSNYKGIIEERIKDALENENLRYKLDFNNKDYREWYYGGVEVEDSQCRDVTQKPASAGSQTAYPPQKYYLKGYETGNYNCKKYDLVPGQLDPLDGSVLQVNGPRLTEFREAYNCCVNRSQNYVCLNYNGTKKFCRAGSKCEINGVYFEAVARDNRSLICAQSYSLCPYNFYVGGGTEICDYFQDGIYNEKQGRYKYITLEDIEKGDCSAKSEIRNTDCTYNEKAGKCKNYCQYMRHCTKTNSVYKYRSNLSSQYFSTACLNFAGDSQNKVSYGTGFILGSARHFTAPIAQCVRETLENVFNNRAGHTKCLLVSDIPNSNGQCQNGVAYKEGDKVESRSFFENTQRYLNFAIKLVLTLSITFLGLKTLLGAQEIKRPEMMLYIIKFAIVVFFALGNAWQAFFFDGVYNSSAVFANMVFKLQMPDQENKRDGCQFGITTDSKGNPIATKIQYPKGKEYLAIWDTLDCKIARYLGFGPEVSTAGVAKLIIAGYITGSIGIYFSTALLFFGFLLISAAIKALHIFLGSAIAVILMVFISPITITAMLFKKTEGIFKGWLKQLIGFSLQPMILFAYIAIFISIFDKTLIGSATFYGPGPYKTISCSKYCVDNLGNTVRKETSPECDRVGEKIINPKSDSFACLIDNNAFSKWPGLELIGISLPFIVEIFAEDAKKKILTLIKGAIIIYFLEKFMTEIPGIASQLIGGGKLPMKAMDAKSMFNATAGLLRGIQKRGARGGLKAGGAIARGAYNKAKELAQRDGNKGKSVKEGGASESPDAAGSSGGGGGDDANSGGGGGDNSGKKGDEPPDKAK